MQGSGYSFNLDLFEVEADIPASPQPTYTILNPKDFEKAYELKPEPKYLVCKANELTNAHFTVSAFAFKIFCALISRIDPTKDNIPEFRYTIRQLADLLKTSAAGVYSRIDAATTELQSQVCRLPIRRDNELDYVDNKSFQKVSWFYQCSYDDKAHTVDFIFHPEMKGYLLNLTNKYTKYYLEEMQRLRTKYSQRLYEILRSYYSLKFVKDGTMSIKKELDYQEIREILGLKNEYPRFSDFKNKLLDKARKEMNETDLNFDYELPERPSPNSRNKVTKIMFNIKAKKRFRDEIKVDTGEITTFLQLRKYIPSANAKALILEYGPERCSQNLEYIYKIDSKALLNIKNMAGYVTSAIKFNYIATGQSLNPNTYSYPLHKKFLKDYLLPIWLKLPKADQDKFVEHGFSRESGRIYDEYIRFQRTQKSQVDPKALAHSKTNKDLVNEALTNISDLSW